MAKVKSLQPCVNPTILGQPELADSTAGKNIIIDKPRMRGQVLGRKVVLEKDDAGKNNLKITVGSSRPKDQQERKLNGNKSDKAAGVCRTQPGLF